jgi:glycosyltransferase involved in cell wall biosynthesis
MVGYREPGWLYELPVPFVWGPIGGVNVFPLQLTRGMPFIQRASMMTYNIVNWLTIRLSPRVRIAAQRAGNQLIFATSETRDKITKTLKLQSTKVLSEVGIADEQVLAPKSLTPGTVQLLWVGQLLHGKALHLALEAVSRIGEDTNWHLTILGEGPEHARMLEYVNDLGIREKVSLKGKVTRQEVFNCMRLADLLLITSLKELTSTVTLEAIACGTPVIAPDHCGFRDVLSEGVGILIPICPRDQFVKLYSRAIEDLGTNQFEYELLSVRSIERAHKYKWSYKEQEINKIYEEALR